MIIINLAQKQDEIQKFMEEKGYAFIKKQGLKLYFNALTENKAEEAKAVKAMIKKHDASIFFSVEVGQA